MTYSRNRANRFWAVADFFRANDKSGWDPAGAAYELCREVDGGGFSWIVRLKIHVAPETAQPRSRHILKASVTWWPAVPRQNSESTLITKRGGWFAIVKRRMRRAGYTGGWESSPHGTFGGFVKDLRSVADLRRESRVLEKLDVSGTPKDP